MLLATSNGGFNQNGVCACSLSNSVGYCYLFICSNLLCVKLVLLSFYCHDFAVKNHVRCLENGNVT
jgi:hypothetical protein